MGAIWKKSCEGARDIWKGVDNIKGFHLKWVAKRTRSIYGAEQDDHHQMKDFLNKTASAMRRSPASLKAFVKNGNAYTRGFDLATSFPSPGKRPALEYDGKLWDYFQAKKGRGVRKWEHYFEIYERHFGKFVGRPVSVAEIGVYSGGSLEMWRDYFGKGARVYGIDIAPECKAYADDGTKIFIGDQADRGFWREFWSNVPELDILIDDGGHTPEQMMVTLEETLPKLNPGGVFLCEDIQGIHHEFTAFVSALVAELNRDDNDKRTDFQKCIHSIHSYPFVTVIEKHSNIPPDFNAPKRGGDWATFRGGK